MKIKFIGMILYYLIFALCSNKPDNVPTLDIVVYPQTMCVIETGAYNENGEALITCATFSDLVYTFYSDGDYIAGDLVALTMSDNGTPEDITDDIIIEARYTGWVEQWGFDIYTNNYIYFFEG